MKFADERLPVGATSFRRLNTLNMSKKKSRLSSRPPSGSW